jgi:hypothetical protein
MAEPKHAKADRPRGACARLEVKPRKLPNVVLARRREMKAAVPTAKERRPREPEAAAAAAECVEAGSAPRLRLLPIGLQKLEHLTPWPPNSDPAPAVELWRHR